MKRRFVVLSVFILAIVAAPSLFAYCEDCPDGSNCIAMDGGARFCVFNPDGSCYGIGWCPQASASLQSEYRVAAVHVIEPGAKVPTAQPQPKAAPLLTASR